MQEQFNQRSLADSEPVTAAEASATSSSLRIFVNGEAKQVAPMSLAQWLDSAGLEAAAVATAVNGDFVARGARAAQALRDGDRLDVFRAIVGG